VTIATEVDHIVPKSQGGTDDDDNLQAICSPCHKTKTGSERR
jgi:5-methylcytosine-specific restriction protein A